MKKWAFIAICLLLCVSLCACQRKPDPEESSSVVSTTDGVKQEPAGATGTGKETGTTTHPEDSTTAATGSGSDTSTGDAPSLNKATTTGSSGRFTGEIRPSATTTPTVASSTRPSATGTATASGQSTTVTDKTESTTGKEESSTDKENPTDGTPGTSNKPEPSQSTPTVPSQGSNNTQSPTQAPTPTQPDLDVELPAAGYDLDGKGRMELKSTTVSGNTVTFVFKNKSKSFMPSEEATLTYTLYDDTENVLYTGSLHIGMIECGKEKAVTLALPADTASLEFGAFTAEYWGAWK